MNGETPGVLRNAIADALRKHPPFDGMEPAALQFLATHLRLGYHAAGSAVLAPEHGEPAAFFIIQRGAVRVRAASAGQAGGDAGWLVLREGETFSVGALLEKRAVSNTYLAAEDSFCYQLARADFDTLLDLSPRFDRYCRHYLASLLRESRRALQIEVGAGLGEQQNMSAPLAAIVKRAPVVCAPDTPLAAALETMREQSIGSMVVVSAEQKPLGIFTRSDVLDRVALARLDLATPISRVMTPAPVALPAQASGYEAACAMAQHGCRHLLVVNDGVLTGVVTERDLFALQRISMRHISRSLATAADDATLEQAGHDIRMLGNALLAQGVSAEQLTAIVSTLNDALTRRVIAMEAARHDLAAINWCWLALGSEGRSEQTFATDQDNGLLFSCDEDEEAGVRGKMLPFADAVNRMLARCGFPLCKGNIMAGNAQWCLSLREWREHFDDWMRNPSPRALLNAAIFFDFRALAGNTELADELREFLLAAAPARAGFLRLMAENALQVKPPLGVLREFALDDDGEYPHSIDLKAGGARLFVDAARVFALAQGVAATSTVQRLREASVRLHIDAGEIASAVEAFYFIQQQRLRRQQGDPLGADAAANRVRPDDLNEIDRRILKEALRQARKLQSRLALDFQL